jgi:plasmid maintenance system antidote protein VapI
MTLSQKNLELFDKWRKLPHEIQNKVARAIGVDRKRVDGFFSNRNDMTFSKVVELEKILPNG